MAGTRRVTKRTVLILLVVSLVLFGLGAGIIDSGDDSPSPDQTPPPSTETTPGVGQPTVTVTPPEGTPTETDQPESTSTGTARPNATETTTPTVADTPATAPNASLRIDASSPEDVENDDGVVGPLWGSLGGTLTWNGSVDSVVIVVSAVAPDEGWVERERVTVRPETDSIEIADVLDGERYRLLGGDLSRGFDNPDGGTTATRTGAVGVTAVLFEDGRERTRVTDTATYRFDVANTGDVDISLSTTDDDEQVTAVSDGGAFAPGRSANRSMTVSNTGSFAGTVGVYVENRRGSENGFAAPEKAVDDDPASELLEQLRIRIAVGSGADRRYVLGGPATWVDLSGSIDENRQITSFGLDPGESRTLVVEWRLPESAGNELMTDTANWDVTFVFESDGAD